MEKEEQKQSQSHDLFRYRQDLALCPVQSCHGAGSLDLGLS
jgi:hypothetical protein